jgi:HEAT repeat protein
MTPDNKPDMKKVLDYTLDKLLQDEDVEIRRDAVCSLRVFKNKSSVVPVLLVCLGDDDWRIRKTAVEVLLSIKNRSIIKVLIKTLHSENANARNAAAEALVASGNEAVELLIETFVSSPPDVKKFIIDIIGTSGDMKVVELLLRAVDDEDDNIKATAIEYLGNLKSILAVDALLSVLERNNMWLNFYAVDALGKINGERAAKALVSLLSRKDLRKPAIKALGIIADSDTLPLIVPFLKDDSKSVREETFITIGEFYKKHVAAEEVTGILWKFFGDETESLFMPYFSSNKEEIKKTSVLLLALLKVKEAVAAIFDMYVDEDLLDTIKKTLTFIGSSSPGGLIQLTPSR